MGDTKDLTLQRGLKFARIITAVLAGLSFVVAIVQLVFFQNIKISFQVGVDAQQVESIKIKKGSNVELPSPMKPGSYFMGWSLSPTSADVIEDSTHLMKNTTLYAVWDGAEKYAVLSVNGLPYGEVNIFDTSVEGLTPAQLNAKWRVLDDFAEDPDGTRLTTVMRIGTKEVKADLRNNFSRFLGWQYLNMYGRYNELRYQADETGMSGRWTLLQRDANGKESESLITDTNKFYPPNYRTTFTALLEYRKVQIMIYDESGNTNYAWENVQLGSAYTFPIFKYDPSLNFSHWEIYGDNGGDYNHNFIDDKDEKQAALIEKLGQVKLRYEGGEILDAVDPLWYYFGSKLQSPDGKSTDLVVTLKVRAKYWEKGDNATVHHYSVQPFTDEYSGNEFIDFEKVTWSNLDLEHPVAYEKENHCIWLLVDNKISSYIFYDHNGVYHELTTANLQASLIGGTNKTIGIGIDVEATVLNQTIYFKNEWAITIGVKYQSAATTVTLKFSYGDDLYLLPDYAPRKNVSVSYPRAIGDKFVLPTGENYMKYDYIFTGWQLAGDESGRLYCAGETYTIPNFNTAENSTVIEFVAVWHLQRLLFNFNFMGGGWSPEKEPDFTLMKGAFGDRVRIIMDIPERFGYDFVGWKLDNEGETLQPGTYITIGTEMQTLYAQWEARRLNVMFRLHADASEDNWYSYGTKTEDSRTGGILYSGGYVALPIYNNNDDGADWYIFNGWKIGDKIYVSKDGQRDVKLDTATLLQLTTENREEYDGTTVLDVYIFADQTRRTVNVDYDLEIATAENGNVKVPVITSKLKSILQQGDLFYNHYPFNVILEDGDYSVFDTGGTQFAAWSYSTDGGKNFVPIDATTIVPAGVEHITIYGGLGSQKSFTLMYYDYLGEHYITDEITYYYNRDITLLTKVDADRSPDERWGTFTGWALTPDYEASNPDVIFDVIYYAERFASEDGKEVVPTLHLSDRLDVNHGPYSINIDQCAERMGVYGANYVLRLYAVYSGNYAKATYIYHAGSGKNTELKLPLYSNNDYTRTVIGGSTVGYDSDDFLEQGLVVLDDSTLDVSSSQNFIGWKMLLPDEVSPEIRERFANKIWFPGEYLPSINFSFELEPIRLQQHNTNVIEYEIGSGDHQRTYRILSLSNAKSKIEINEDVDIVALPRGTYTVPQGTIIINSKREVHVVVPSNGGITLEPRAIQCDTIKEFYVGDKLNITGSPVVGASFQAYRVKKGYRVVEENDAVSEDIIDPSEKYDFASAFTSGLLVSKERNVLHGVPSHSNLTTEKLLKILTDYPITHIQEYALSDLNNIAVINLGINVAKDQTLRIDDFAIFNGTAKEIILPASQQANDNFVIGSQVIAGALRNLTTVTFGNGTADPSRTWYAFVNNGFVYYVDNPAQPSLKSHVMYVLPSASLEALQFTTRNLRFENTVTKIEPYALMGRDWSQINSIMVRNSVVDLRNLQGIPNNIPIFTNADNPNRGPMIQPYEKTFNFVYYDSASSYTEAKLTFVYGETFTVFNAQKNKYDFYFDKLWSQFVAWKLKGYSADKLFYVGEVYKVGISEEISGEDYKYELTFNAADVRCWTSYPVQFYAYNPTTGKNEAYSPAVFYDLDGVDYSIDDLLTYYNDLNEIYLPAITDENKRSFTEPVSGAHYQFIGWSTTALDLKKINMWNNISMQQRILPNHTPTAVLNCGYGYQEGNINIYRYYALYELVTDGLDYELLNDDTFMVTGGLKDYNISSLNIPFAYYHAGEHENEGYMLPVSKIKDNAFSAIRTTLSEIAIGGAVSEIGQSAFYSVKAAEINFAQKGRGIYYNYRQTTAVRQLKIGDLAFANNSELTTLVLPVALETLGSRVFQSCSSLVSVKFEAGDTSALRVIGDEVFSGDRNMSDNAIIPLLTADTKGTRFSSVGAGIFMNTNIRNLTTPEGQVTNKIVWKDTLLYVYYPTGFTTDMTFSEKEIAGYAFVNAYSTTDTTMQISLRFTNANVQIHANAFGYLPKSINSINLRSVKADNVDVNAFDAAITHRVTVTTQNINDYNTKFASLLDANKNYIFS